MDPNTIYTGILITLTASAIGGMIILLWKHILVPSYKKILAPPRLGNPGTLTQGGCLHWLRYEKHKYCHIFMVRRGEHHCRRDGRGWQDERDGAWGLEARGWYLVYKFFRRYGI